jgi:hypothetical protein
VGGYQRNIVLCKCARGASCYPIAAEESAVTGRTRDGVKILKMPERVVCLQQLIEGRHCRVGNAGSPGFYTRLSDSL